MAALSHLNALRALEASVRLGSFKAAAAELGVTPAAVGQQVRNLEAALGQKLIERRANGFAPTEGTRAAAAVLATGFDELRRAVAMLAQGEALNRVFVTVSPSIGERWLAPRLANFLARHAEIDLRIDSTPFVHYGVQSEFDFAIRYDRPGRATQAETELFREVLIPVCTPDVAVRIGPVEKPDCLVEAPMIHVDRSTDDAEWLHWEEWGARFGYEIPRRQRGLHATFTTMALRALYDGAGLHLAQLSITVRDLVSGRLVAPFGVAKCVRPAYPYSLIKLGTGRSTLLQSAFRDWIAGEASTTQAEMDAYLAPGR